MTHETKSAVSDRRPRWQTFFGRPTLVAFLVALGLAALYGRVALLNLGSGVVGGDLDGYENLWNDHWVRTALLDLKRNPFFTDYLYYPTGISLRYHTLNPLNGLFAIPLWPLIGSVATTNLKFLLAMALTVFCSYLLFKDLVGQPLPALAGAAVFTFANDQILGFYSFGQAEKLSMWWLPLYFFCMFRALHRPHWARYIAAAVGCLLAMALTDWQFVLHAVVLTVGYFIFSLFTRQSWATKRTIFLKLVAIGLLWLAIVWFPLLWPMLKEAQVSPWLSVSEQSSVRSRALVDFGEIGLGNPGYLALISGIAGLVLLWRRKPAPAEKRMVIFWIITAIVASVISLGPELKLTQTADDQTTGIPMPYALFYKLPVLSIGRDPGRFYLLAMLGFGLLLAYGLRELLAGVERWGSGVGGWGSEVVRSPLVGILLVIIVLTVTLGGFVVKAGEAQANPPDWPAFYYELAKDKESYAILELPLFTEKGRGEDTYEAYQSIHGKPRFGGRLARDHKLTNPNNFTKTATLFRDFFWLQRSEVIEKYRPFQTGDFLQTPDYAQWSLPLLNYYKVRYIILYPDALKDTSPQAQTAAEKMVRLALGQDVKPVYQDAKLIAYRVPDAPPPASSLFIDTGSNGWYPAEPGPEGTFRWADACSNSQAEQSRQLDKCNNQPSELLVFNLSQTRQRAKIQFIISNYRQARQVNISINGFPVQNVELEAGASREITLELDIPPGLNKLTLTSPQPPVPVNQPKDNRFLSFTLQRVRLSQS